MSDEEAALLCGLRVKVCPPVYEPLLLLDGGMLAAITHPGSMGITSIEGAT
jgi:hypothetical protein